MQALRVHEFGDPEVLRLEAIDDPVPGEGEVLISMRAVGINPVDTYVRAGAYERLPELPFIPGGDGAGVIEALGPEVEDFQPGDRVYVAGAAGGSLTGCSASLATKPLSQVFRLPENISFEQGAALGVPYATAYRALIDKGEPKPGETVFVHGASGGVGIAAVQLAVGLGLRVAGSASSERARQMILEQGAELAVDHSRDGYRDEIHAWTDGQGASVILEMAAHVNLNHDLNLAAKGGRIVVIGCRGSVEIQPRLAMGKDLTIRALALSNASEVEMARIHEALVAGLEAEHLKPIVGQVFSFREAAQAHRAVSQPGSVFGKVILIPESD